MKKFIKEARDWLRDMWGCDELRFITFLNGLFLVIYACLIFATAHSINAQIKEITDSVDRLEDRIETLEESVDQLGEISSTKNEVNSKPEEVSEPLYSDEEIDLIAICTMAEAEGEPELGQRLVIDTILNRLDSPYFSYDSIHDVIYAPNQFTSMTNGRADKCYVKESIRKLVLEEMDRRTDSQVLYFRTGQFHDFGTKLYKVGNHYFSTR